MIKFVQAAIADFAVSGFAIVLSALLLLPVLLPEPVRMALYFTPEQFGNGQWWLLFSSQWVHLNVQHTLSNVLGVIVLCGFMLPQASTTQLTLCTLCCLLSISMLLLLFPTLYVFYAGFSGILYGLFFFAGLSYWQQDKTVCLLVLSVILAKLGWDIAGPSAYEAVDWLGARIAVEVHIAGIVGALVFFGVGVAYRARRRALD